MKLGSGSTRANVWADCVTSGGNCPVIYFLVQNHLGMARVLQFRCLRWLRHEGEVCAFGGRISPIVGVPGTKSHTIGGPDMGGNKPCTHVFACTVAVLLVSASSYGETITWSGDGDATSWHDPANWDLVRVPDGDDVVIPDLVATTAVVYSSGTTLVNSLDSEEAFELSGGTVIIETASLIDASYTQTGGNLDGAGTLTVTGLLTWSGGDMQGTGITNADGGMVVDGVVDLQGDGISGNGLSRTLNNNSTDPGATFTGLAEINMTDEAVFNNTGTVYVETDRPVLDWSAGSPPAPTAGRLSSRRDSVPQPSTSPFATSGPLTFRSGR